VTHAHRFLYLGDLVTDGGVSRPVRWCSDCGTAIECFPRQVAEITPAWAKAKLAEAVVRRADLSSKEPAWKAKSGIGSRLGRTLADVRKEREGVGSEGFRRLMR
jgi:hypothetical protein